MKFPVELFKKLRKKNPGLSSWVTFAIVIADKPLSKKQVKGWFERLVDKSDYKGSGTKQLLAYLYTLLPNKK